MEVGLQILRSSYGGGFPEGKIWLRRWSSRLQGLVMEVELQKLRSGY